MEKLIKNKKNLYIAGSIILILILSAFYVSINNNSKNEKYFDIILASLYNNEEDNLENRLSFLSSLDNPNISFFSDLNSASIKSLEKYEKLDRDLILLKKTILEIGANKEDIEKIMNQGKEMENNSNQILDFTKKVKNMDENDKIKIIESLWKIIYSNKEADIYETNLMRRLAGLLYIDSKIMGDIKEKFKKENIR